MPLHVTCRRAELPSPGILGLLTFVAGVPAGAFVATLPLLVMLFIGGRQIVRGIMEGAVKS